ncbi:hypothetical protein ABPG72_010210 [Tetrahymena utriculariae]
MEKTSSQTFFLTNLKYKEDPAYWTQQKLLSFLDSIQKDEIKDIIQTIKENKLQINDLMNSRQEEIDRIFQNTCQLMHEIISYLKKPQTLDNIVGMVQTEELNETYAFNTQDSITDDKQNDEFQQKTNQLTDINLPQTYTQHSASSTRFINVYDYDNYPCVKEAMDMFDKIIKNELFLQIQEQSNDYIKKNISIQLQLQLSQNPIESLVIDHTKNQKQFLQKLGELSNNQLIIEFMETDQMYYIQDKGGIQPNYIKFKQDVKIPLFVGSILRIGSYEYQFIQVCYDYEKVKITLKDVSNKHIPVQQFDFKIYKSEKLILSSSSLNQEQGQKLNQDKNTEFKDIHIYNDGTQIFLRNYNQNNTWIRLSKENVQSHYQSLKNVDCLRLGEQVIQVQINVLYKSQKTKQLDKMLGDIDISYCQYCKINKLKIIYYPCKHKVMCLSCYKIQKPSTCSSINCYQKIANFYSPS